MPISVKLGRYSGLNRGGEGIAREQNFKECATQLLSKRLN